ncbi:type II secretion system F family protein [Neobacillus sp. SAB-20_R2A]|uniref:type II secretion system F family protein n=1 Tax=Neobacillus sp. SAB-20_R2A TaxID=3120519 RepID=UPI003C6DF55C
MNYINFLYLVGSILLFMVLFQFLLSYFLRKSRFKKRLKNYDLILKHPEEKDEIDEKKPKQNLATTLIKKIGTIFESNSKSSKWPKLLIQANSRLSQGEFLFFRLLALIVLVLSGYVLKVHWLLLIPLGILGFWLPVLHLKKKIEKRLNRGSYQLAEALGTMANSMRAGFSFMQAMKLISEEFPDPLGPEFEKTLTDINYGIPVEEAFLRMLERLPDKELEMAVKAMLIQRASGGNLAVLLEIIQETVTGRLQIKDEIRTLTAQGKLSTWIITGLPIGLGIYLRFANPEYFNLLTEDLLGIVMLCMAAIGIVLGWLLIRKIVRIEV